MDNRRLNKALKILKNENSLRCLRSNELIRRLMDKEEPMARQTAINTINEGVRNRKIFKDDSKKDKQVVYYTLYPDITDEKFLLIQTEKHLKNFDDEFSIFEDKFSRLSIKEKSECVEGFGLFLTQLNLAVISLRNAFEKKRRWKDLQNEVISRMNSLTKLVKSSKKKEQYLIGRHVLEGRLLYLDQAKGFLDEYLNELK